MSDPLDITSFCFNTIAYSNFPDQDSREISPSTPVNGFYFFHAQVFAATFIAPAGYTMCWQIVLTHYDSSDNEIESITYQQSPWTQVTDLPEADSNVMASIQISSTFQMSIGDYVEVTVWDMNPDPITGLSHFILPSVDSSKSSDIFEGFLLYATS